MVSDFEQKLIDCLETEAASHDTEIVTVSVCGPKNSPICRVYIDMEDGVSFDELSTAQDWISDCLESLDPFVGAYTLEVSSPGIDRPLRTIEHFKRFEGQTVKLKTSMPIGDRRNFIGKLTRVNGEIVEVDCEGVVFEIDFNNIKKANLVGLI